MKILGLALVCCRRGRCITSKAFYSGLPQPANSCLVSQRPHRSGLRHPLLLSLAGSLAALLIIGRCRLGRPYTTLSLCMGGSRSIRRRATRLGILRTRRRVFLVPRRSPIDTNSSRRVTLLLSLGTHSSVALRDTRHRDEARAAHQDATYRDEAAIPQAGRFRRAIP